MRTLPKRWRLPLRLFPYPKNTTENNEDFENQNELVDNLENETENFPLKLMMSTQLTPKLKIYPS